MHSITLLIKPASYQCNIHCAHCFYQRVRDVYPMPKPFMDVSTARTLIRKTLQLGCEENYFCWQGGEPTLMGVQFFREVVKFQQQFALPGQIIGNSLQTNGVLLDREWVDFFAESRFFIGLSLDGPGEFHDRYRKFLSGRGTFERVMHAARLMKSHGVQFNILTLLTDGNVSQPGSLYGFFRNNGFNHLQFIPCFEIDPVTGLRSPFSISSDALGRFHCELFDLWLADGFSEVSIRTFEDILIYHIDGVQVSCNWADRCASYLVIEHNGDVFPCDFFVYPEWKLGNIVADSYYDILASPLRQEFAGRKENLPEGCSVCRWLAFCRGDCTKFRTGGQGGSAATSVFCSARKMLLEHMEPHFASIKEKALRIRQAQQKHAHAGRIGRNALCPCGSGGKYKKCCGR